MIDLPVLPTRPSGVVPSYIAAPGGHRNGHAARLACHWVAPSVAVISAHGEIDASNAGSLTDYAVAYVKRSRALVLDLSELEFIGTEGFAALHMVSVSCARVGTSWAMVPGSAVTHLLRICDPQGLLPTARTADAAVATFPGPTSHRPEFITTSRSGRDIHSG